MADDDGEAGKRIGTVKYLYDAEQETLSRREWSYPNSEEETQSEVVAKGIKSCRFAYKGEGEEEWGGVWDQPTNFPAQVSMELLVSEGGMKIAVEREFPLVEALWRDK